MNAAPLSAVGEPPQNLPIERRLTLAWDLLETAGGDISGAELIKQAGLPYHQAYEVKRRWRAQHLPQKRKPRARRSHTPSEVSWSLIQDFLDAHPGVEFTRSQLSRVTGVPETTITNLWQERLGHGYDGRRPAAPAPVLQPVRWPVGGVFTICGQHGDDILADYEGSLVRLSIRPAEGGG
jgi:hypothetical protein